jgi:O-antigen biosynthesis protein
MRTGVVVGVHAHAQPERLVETVRWLQFGGGADEIVLLPDGPDVALSAALSSEPVLSALPQWGSAEPLGAPACFNRLTSGTDASVVVLVQSGTLPAPGCLALLAEALTHPGRGLAGPTTNLWSSEQGVFRFARASEVTRTGALARQSFGAAIFTLKPLHDLADFCLAVARPVIETIGEADEEYGIGPGWAMDYNTRAARAGFEVVWVGAAYAYRHPPTGRSRTADDQLTLHHPLTVSATHGARAPAAAALPPSEPAARPDPPPAPARKPAAPKPALPLVTAIMPTRDRPEFALQAVRDFCAQDYPNKELLVLEDGTPSLAGRLPDDPRIRYVATRAAARSTGAMRNEACRLARSEIVAHWDDDDWYGHERLTRQVAAIRAGEADITGLRNSLLLDLQTWRFWRCQPDLYRRLFGHEVDGGTLVYRRRVWQDKAQFPDCPPGEDTGFLDRAVRGGARLQAVDAEGIFVHVCNGPSARRIVCGLTGGADGWESVPEPDLSPDARAFYAGRSAAVPESSPTPLVSCVMPTYDRRAFVPQAVRYFLRQDYPAKELIVVDDGPEPVSDLLPADPRIVYHRLETRTMLGAKRNVACDLAHGPIIVHWDDDDWASADRVSIQVAALTGGDADICGASSLLCYDPAAASAWRFTWPDRLRPWVAGTSLCFRKEFWARCPFPDVAIGEDTRFVFNPAVHGVTDVSTAGCVVALIHCGNTVPKTVHGAHWSRCPSREVEDLLGDDLAFYRRLRDAAPGRSPSIAEPASCR